MISSMLPDTISKVRQVENLLAVLPQVELPTLHTIHGKVYTRTICLRKDEALTSALIRVPTTLVIAGNVIVYTEEGFIEIKGYNVIPASKDRKQIMRAIEDTFITMILETDKNTVEDIEDYFTEESKLLMSRQPEALNKIIITGE